MKYTKMILATAMAFGMLSVTACGSTETESESQADNSIQAAESITEAVNAEVETPVAENITAEETADSATDTPSIEEPQAASEEKILIAYFSNPQTEGTDADSSASRTIDSAGIVVGNVEYTASLIQNQVGGDLFRIETVQPYPAGYRDTTDQAKEEQNANARPELVNHLDDVSQYETVYLGFPNWWGDMPMAVYSFLDEYDFSGTNIHVFVLHGGSRASGTVSTIQSLEPDATVSDDPLTLYWNEISDAESRVADWLN